MPCAFKSFVELFCSTLCQEYTDMSKIKRNTMPLITQGPLQAFDVELETAGLCVSVCVYMPSSTALTGSSGDNWCCLSPIPVWLTSPALLPHQQRLPGVAQSLLQDQDSLGSRQRGWRTQTRCSRTPWSLSPACPWCRNWFWIMKKRTVLPWSIGNKNCFWILWLVSSPFSPRPSCFFFCFSLIEKTTTKKTPYEQPCSLRH